MTALQTYGIDTGNGDCITTGVQGEVVVQRIAQREADRRGEAVYVYSLSGREVRGEWEADESWTVEPSA